MFRIDLVSASEREVVLSVQGIIAEQTVELLAEAGRAWLHLGRQLVLDIEGVEFIDPAGLALLREWSGQGLVIRGASLYVRYLLQNQELINGAGSPEES